MGPDPCGDGENHGKTGVATVPLPISSQPLQLPPRFADCSERPLIGRLVICPNLPHRLALRYRTPRVFG